MEKIDMIRETDRWLRRWALIAPLLAYMFGSINGFVFGICRVRDFDRRLCLAEDTLRTVSSIQSRMIGLLESEHHIQLH